MLEAAAIRDEGLDVESMALTEEPYTLGTYVNFQPGQLTRFGRFLRQPHGPVHFASAERSSWPTFMEGVVESGKRAAADVLAEIAARAQSYGPQAMGAGRLTTDARRASRI